MSMEAYNMTGQYFKFSLLFTYVLPSVVKHLWVVMKQSVEVKMTPLAVLAQ